MIRHAWKRSRDTFNDFNGTSSKCKYSWSMLQKPGTPSEWRRLSSKLLHVWLNFNASKTRSPSNELIFVARAIGFAENADLNIGLLAFKTNYGLPQPWPSVRKNTLGTRQYRDEKRSWLTDVTRSATKLYQWYPNCSKFIDRGKLQSVHRTFPRNCEYILEMELTNF